MYGYLEKLRPETIRVYAACLEHQRRFGEKPSTEAVVELAKAEGANVCAALVLCRNELFAKDGTVVPLREYGRPPVVVPDVQTIWAILLRGLPAAELRSPQGRLMRRQKLDDWADAWEKQERMAEQ